MAVFLDTSAIYALLDADDRNHPPAVSTYERLLNSETLVTHNYVVIEAGALVERRLGKRVARMMLERTLGLVEIEWVSPDAHSHAVAAFLADPASRISLVDRVSFAVMKARDINLAFTFDVDFQKAGFSTLP